MSFTQMLQIYDKVFGECEVIESAYEDVPEGKYQVRVEGASIKEAKFSGNLVLNWKLKIISPEYAGRYLWKNQVLTSESALKWVKNDLYICGLKIEKISELPDCLDHLKDLELEINKTVNENYENIYFNKLLKPNDQNKGSVAIDDEDIPF
jgi:hypothetical protein